MRKIIRIVFLGMLVGMTGCSTIRDWMNSGSGKNITAMTPVNVWTGPLDTYHAVGLLGTKDLLFLTTSNVGRGTYRSKIFTMNKSGEFKLVYQGGQETIGQPFEHDGKVYFPVEHGANVLVWDNGSIRAGAKTSGRWNISGVSYDKKPLMAYNNQYAGNFKDQPVIAHAETGVQYKTYPAITFPRSFTVLDGDLCMTGDYGEDVLFVGNEKRPSRMLHIAAYKGKLYGGGGMNWGPASIPDGRLFEGDSKSEKVIADTGCRAIEHVTVLDGVCFFAGTDPDRLWAVGKNGKPIQVCEILGDPIPKRGGAFGAAVAYFNESYWFFRTGSNNAYLYRLK